MQTLTSADAPPAPSNFETTWKWTRRIAPFIAGIVAALVIAFLDQWEAKVAATAVLVISAMVLGRRTYKFTIGTGENGDGIGVKRNPKYLRRE